MKTPGIVPPRPQPHSSAALKHGRSEARPLSALVRIYFFSLILNARRGGRRLKKISRVNLKKGANARRDQSASDQSPMQLAFQESQVWSKDIQVFEAPKLFMCTWFVSNYVLFSEVKKKKKEDSSAYCSRFFFNV